jgi:hypothetical protein
MRRDRSVGTRPWTDASKGWADSVKRTEEPQLAIEPLLVPERVAAAMLGVSPRTMWKLGKSGAVAFKRIGGRKNYLMSSLKMYAETGKEVA